MIRSRYRKLEEEVYELRSENNVLRDKVKILQDLLNSKDRTIPRGTPMEPHTHEEDESEEDEEDDELKALERNIILPSTSDATSSTSNNITTDTLQPIFPSQALAQTQPHNKLYRSPMDPYNKSSMYYLLVLFMMLIFVSFFSFTFTFIHPYSI